MKQTLEVDFFGLAIYKTISYDGKPKWYCYFVLDLGKRTNNPILMWSMHYKNKKTVQKMQDICVNGGLAILNKNKMGSKSGISVAERVMTTFKMKFFGSNDIPILHLTEEQYKSRYSRLGTHCGMNMGI